MSSAEVQQHSAIYVVFRETCLPRNLRGQGALQSPLPLPKPEPSDALQFTVCRRDQHHTLLSYCENQSVNKEHNYMSFDHHVFFFFFLILLSLSRRTLAWKYIQRRGDYYDKVVYFFKAVQ